MNEQAKLAATIPEAPAGLGIGPMWIIWMTCCGDNREHAVTDDHFAAGTAAGQGTYLAVCGHVVCSRALTSPPGRPCQHCLAELDQWRPPPKQTRRWLRVLTRWARQRR